MDNTGIMGRKIFFIQSENQYFQELFHAVSNEEYEVYPVNNKEKIAAIAHSYGDCVFVVNFDNFGDNWINVVKGLRSEYNGIFVLGLVSSKNGSMSSQIAPAADEIAVLTSRLESDFGRIVQILNRLRVRGRRKWVRAQIADETLVGLNISANDAIERGSVIDISSFAMACKFQKQISFSKDVRIEVQIRAKHVVKMFSVEFLGAREDDPGIKIFRFLYDKDPYLKNTVRKIVTFALTEKIKHLL